MKVYGIIFWLLAAVIKFYVILLGGGQISMFLDPLSMLFVFGISLLLTFTFASPKNIGEYFMHAISNREISELEYQKASTFFHHVSSMVIFVGILGTMIGCILILRGIGKGATSEMIGKGAAVAFITLYYAISTKIFIIIPMQGSLNNKRNLL